MDPAQLIRSTRKSRLLTQKELARLVGTTQSAIARIELGKLSPTVSTLDRLLSVMGEELVLETTPITAEHSGIDRSLIGSNLRLSPRERLEQLESAARGVEKLKQARKGGE